MHMGNAAIFVHHRHEVRGWFSGLNLLQLIRARIWKRVRSPGNQFQWIDSASLCTVARRAGTSNRFCCTGPPVYIDWGNGFLGIDSWALFTSLQIRAQYTDTWPFLTGFHTFGSLFFSRILLTFVHCSEYCSLISLFTYLHTVKKLFDIPSGCQLPNKLSQGGNYDVIYKLFLPRESLVSDILAGDGNIEKLIPALQKLTVLAFFLCLF